jgi:hypothetical protein
MTTTVAKKKAAAKPSKISKTHKPTKAETERKTHLDFDKRMIGRKHHRWIKSNPSANLGNLLQYLEGVKKELEAFNDDDVVSEIINELDDAYDYLLGFDPVDEHVDGDEKLATVRYRLDDVEGDIGEIEELIEALGESFSVKRLPKWKPRAKAS